MNNSYRDIRERINEEPIWFDEQAVPRYCDFTPSETANIYADAVVLYQVECQGCGAVFAVASSDSKMDRYMAVKGNPPGTPKALEAALEAASLEARVRAGALHYGDPPNADCCAAGPTMNSVPRRVLEFWRQGGSGRLPEWERVSELEGMDLTPDWAESHSREEL